MGSRIFERFLFFSYLACFTHVPCLLSFVSSALDCEWPGVQRLITHVIYFCMCPPFSFPVFPLPLSTPLRPFLFFSFLFFLLACFSSLCLFLLVHPLWPSRLPSCEKYKIMVDTHTLSLHGIPSGNFKAIFFICFPWETFGVFFTTLSSASEEPWSEAERLVGEFISSSLSQVYLKNHNAHWNSLLTVDFFFFLFPLCYVYISMNTVVEAVIRLRSPSERVSQKV